MNQKKIWSGMLVLALVFGLFLAGCGKDDDDDSDPEVPLPNVYQNTTWVNTLANYNHDEYFIISFGTTTAGFFLYPDTGIDEIKSLEGVRFDVKEVVPDNDYTNALKVNISRIRFAEYVPSSTGGGIDNPAPPLKSAKIIDIYVKDDGTGIRVGNGTSYPGDNPWEKWEKKQL